MKRERTKYRGVYERIADERTHNGKPDICFDITFKKDGKKIWEKVGWLSDGYSAKLADQVRAERLRSIRHGEDLPQERKKAPFFKEVAEKYLEWAETNKVREGKEDEYRYKKHLAPRFENKRLNEISSFSLEKLKSDLSKSGLSPASVKHCLVLFRQMVNKAIHWKMYQGENPIKGVKMPILQNQRQRFLTHEEANQLLNQLTKTSRQLHDIALLSLQTGLRAGEIFNLKGQDLDFENKLITISNPKNLESRKAFMTKSVKKMLVKRITDSPDEYVFKDRKHKGKIQGVSRAFFKTFKELKLNEGITDPRQKISFHSLRHTFASWLALQGEPILTIKELLGHKTLAMTAKYAHLSPDHKRGATLRLEKAFEESRNGVDETAAVEGK